MFERASHMPSLSASPWIRDSLLRINSSWPCASYSSLPFLLAPVLVHFVSQYFPSDPSPPEISSS